jgi:flavin reductase (DIM6/NTAB) family NADH-FMN oxidoreductase RutF
MRSIDPKSLRRAVGQFATGVTIVTFKADGDVRAMTVNSFTLLSFDPPLVLVRVHG